MRLQSRLRVNLPNGLVAALALLIVLTVARFGQSLWIDEASSVWFSRLPVGSLMTSLCDPHPPGYYLTLKLWTILGDSEAWLRTVSLIAGLGSIALIYRIAKDRIGSTGATLAALLLALQPLHSWYASEARMYAWVECAGLLALWLGWRLIDRGGSARRWALYALAVELAIWLDYTAALPLALLQLIWIARGCPQWRRWISLHILIALPIGVLWLTSNQLASFGHGYQPVFVAILAAKFGVNLTPAIAAGLIQVTALAAISVAVFMAFYARRHVLLNSSRLRLAIMIISIGLLVFSALPLAFTLKRLVVVIVPYVVLAATAVIVRWPPQTKRASLVVSAFAALLALVTFQRDPWRAVVQELATGDQHTVIWVDELSVPAVDYYERQFDPASHTRWTPLIGRALPALPALAPAPTETLLIVTEETNYRNLVALLPSEFWTEYQPLTARRDGSLVVYRYQRRSQPDPTILPPRDRNSEDEWGLLLPSPLDTCTR